MAKLSRSDCGCGALDEDPTHLEGPKYSIAHRDCQYPCGKLSPSKRGHLPAFEEPVKTIHPRESWSSSGSERGVNTAGLEPISAPQENGPASRLGALLFPSGPLVDYNEPTSPQPHQRREGMVRL